MKKFFLILSALCMLGLQSALAEMDLNQLTFSAWKFNYSYQPATTEVVKRSTAESFTLIKFNGDKSFILVSNEKVESGTWELVTLNGTTTVKFNFDNSEFWPVKTLERNLLVFNQKKEVKLLEYYFSPATSEKDIRLFVDKMNSLILEMEGVYKLLSISTNSQTKAYYNTIEKIKELDGIPVESHSDVAPVEFEKQAAKIGFFKKMFGKNKSEENSKSASAKPEETLYFANTESGHDAVNSEDANTNNIRNLKYTYTPQKSDHIEIFVSGGGLQAGINPKINDQIVFHNNGLVQKMYESKLGGKVSSQRKISREQLQELALIIIKQGYFELESEYACGEDDEVCQTRVLLGPKPIPLSIIVKVGEYKHVVSIPVYAPDRYRDIGNYPESITYILNTIYRYASL